MAAASIPPRPTLEGDGTLPREFIQAATAHSLCVALVDAAQHMRRTSMAAEAASIAALRQALAAAPGDDRWRQTLEGANQTVRSATALFSDIIDTAKRAGDESDRR